MEFFQTYGKELFSLVVPLVSLVINRSSNKGARLVHGTKHSFTFLVQEPLTSADGTAVQPNQVVHTASVVVQNLGGAACTNVELVFNWKPMCLNIWPARRYDMSTDVDGRYVLRFSSLAPQEYFQFELLSVNLGLPQLINARCDQGVAKDVVLIFQARLPRWQMNSYRVLRFAGLAAAAYAIVLLIQALVLLTPLGLGR